jgi:hypothetical protein
VGFSANDALFSSHRERYIVIAGAKFMDSSFVPGLLFSKFIAGDSDDDQVAVAIFFPQCLQLRILGCVVAFRGRIDEQQRLTGPAIQRHAGVNDRIEPIFVYMHKNPLFLMTSQENSPD